MSGCDLLSDLNFETGVWLHSCQGWHKEDCTEWQVEQLFGYASLWWRWRPCTRQSSQAPLAGSLSFLLSLSGSKNKAEACCLFQNWNKSRSKLQNLSAYGHSVKRSTFSNWASTLNRQRLEEIVDWQQKATKLNGTYKRFWCCDLLWVALRHIVTVLQCKEKPQGDKYGFGYFSRQLNSGKGVKPLLSDSRRRPDRYALEVISIIRFFWVFQEVTKQYNLWISSDHT